MALTLRKVRVLLVVCAVILLAVVGGFLWYGHNSARRFFVKLPRQLGVDVRQETNGFTYSQSVKGHTAFTVHAAREVQHANGVITLSDVGITLYGQDQKPADHIHGDQFEFDQAKGILSARSEVFLDLQMPKDENAKSAGAGEEDRMLHVRTSGLIFDQKARTAATSERIEFASGALTGHATGAHYDQESGTLELVSAVELSGFHTGRTDAAAPETLQAAHAEYDRVEKTVRLQHAEYRAADQSFAGERVLVNLDGAGHPEGVQAEGQVRLAAKQRGMLSGARLDVMLSENGRLRSAHMSGGVAFEKAAAGGASKGRAGDLQVAFDGQGLATRVVLTGGVQVWNHVAMEDRSLEAQRLVVTLAGAPQRQPVLAVANGSALVKMMGASSAGRTGQAMGQATGQATEIRGDELTAHFSHGRGKPGLEALEGHGSTLVRRRAADGSEETSAAPMLQATFTRSGEAESTTLKQATQSGGVTVARTLPAKAGLPAEQEHAEAQTAMFDGSTDQLALRGSVRIRDAVSLLLADQASIERRTGDATAEGNLRVSYASAGGGEPVHLIAAKAVEHKVDGTADFFGDGTRLARMWQGGSQIEAPVLHFDRGKKMMVARGTLRTGGASDADALVRAVLLSDQAAKDTLRKPGKGGPTRLAGRVMTYSEATREVHLAGDVRIDGPDGTVRAREATAYLHEPAANLHEPEAKAGTTGNAGAAMLQGRVERIVARGAVNVEQPGRRASGEQLTYTAADQLFVMTGTRGAPPHVVDDLRGSSTGAALRFRTGDESVTIVSGDDSSGATHVHSEARAPESKPR